MTFLRVLASRIWALFHARKLDIELEEEIRGHLAELEREYIRAGMNAEDARHAAKREFGGVAQMQEIYREQRSLPLWEILSQDLRYSIRTLMNAPGFSLVAVLTLALGVGVNTAIFSAVNAIVLRSLPYVDADRLVALWEFNARRPARSTVAPANLLEYQRQNRVFSGMAGYALIGKNLTESGPPQRLWADELTFGTRDSVGAWPDVSAGRRSSR